MHAMKNSKTPVDSVGLETEICKHDVRLVLKIENTGEESFGCVRD